MNSLEYQQKIFKLLKKLKEDLPEAERLAIIEELEELLSVFFV